MIESNEDENRAKNITGVMVQYYTACKTELWYFANHISYNDEDENIKIGRLIHEESFKQQKKKNIQIDNSISIDYIKTNSGEVVIHEIKKSSRLEAPVRSQVLYYLWYLKNKGIAASAMIIYPKERRRKQALYLSKTEEENIKNSLTEINQIIRLDKPPTPSKKPYCRRCSYFELCWC